MGKDFSLIPVEGKVAFNLLEEGDIKPLEKLLQLR
jgi:hypothetical protein